VALNSHLQVAQGIRAALATRTAALSGSQTKAPGSAGGYLLVRGRAAHSVVTCSVASVIRTSSSLRTNSLLCNTPC
jgi:hypothetical protein